MNMQKYAAFDIGNVLCHVEFEKLFYVMSDLLDMDYDEILIFLNAMHKFHDLGLTSLEEELEKKLELDYEISPILKEWDECIKPNPLMINLLQELRDNNVNIAFLSNVGVEHVEIIKILLKKFGLEDIILWFSCEINVRKPSPLFFQSFLIQHPEFKGCPYFDDLQDNLNIAQKNGFISQKFVLSNYFPIKIGSTSLKKPIYEEKKEDQEAFKNKIKEIKDLILKGKHE